MYLLTILWHGSYSLTGLFGESCTNFPSYPDLLTQSSVTCLCFAFYHHGSLTIFIKNGEILSLNGQLTLELQIIVVGPANNSRDMLGNGEGSSRKFQHLSIVQWRKINVFLLKTVASLTLLWRHILHILCKTGHYSLWSWINGYILILNSLLPPPHILCVVKGPLCCI